MRHWKQRYSFDADLIFTRTMKLGICGVATVHAGDSITPEMKAILGRNRLKLWWETKRIELANFDGDLGRVVEPKKAKKKASKKSKTKQENLDTDHALGGPSVDEPELGLPRLDTPPNVSPF
tara:strand:+ start:18644 stop:19009 length:366 start_codon:yes stop_codon:yes gene_type:complete